ncbi:hypothetical protein CEN40_09580 [Fischerella thermalis CCMEE 5205]|nr:hypothetical protein CEN40_09580 [Fischerella thermalis CCMEE 5205]
MEVLHQDQQEPESLVHVTANKGLKPQLLTKLLIQILCLVFEFAKCIRLMVKRYYTSTPIFKR